MAANPKVLVHVGCKALGLDAEDRAALQLRVVNKSSLNDMSDAEILKVVDELKRLGFKPTKKGGKRPAAPRADLRLIHVLWRKLGEADVLERPDRAGLNAFIRTRFGEQWGSVPADIDQMRDHHQIDQVVQALKNWAKRADIDFDWSGLR